MHNASGSIPASILTLLILWQLDLKGEAARSLVNVVLALALVLMATPAHSHLHNLAAARARLLEERLRQRLQDLNVEQGQ